MEVASFQTNSTDYEQAVRRRRRSARPPNAMRRKEHSDEKAAPKTGAQPVVPAPVGKHQPWGTELRPEPAAAQSPATARAQQEPTAPSAEDAAPAPKPATQVQPDVPGSAEHETFGLEAWNRSGSSTGSTSTGH